MDRMICFVDNNLFFFLVVFLFMKWIYDDSGYGGRDGSNVWVYNTDFVLISLIEYVILSF